MFESILNSKWKIMIWLICLLLVIIIAQQKFNFYKYQITPATPSLNMFSIKHPYYQTEFQYHRTDPHILTFIGTTAGKKDEILINYPTLNELKLSYENSEALGIVSTKATYGSVAFDLDKQGYTDLFVTREDGVYLYKNTNNFPSPVSSPLKSSSLAFREMKLLDKQPGLTPFHLTIHDFNLDGNPDLFIRQFYDDNPMKEGPYVILQFYKNLKWINVTNKYENITIPTSHQSDKINDDDHFIDIKLPKTIDYATCRVAVIIGNQMYVKYNQINSDQGNLNLTFNIGKNKTIDRVRIRTIYNKEKVFLEPKIDSLLTVNPVVHFEAKDNNSRMTSMGAA